MKHFLMAALCFAGLSAAAQKAGTACDQAQILYDSGKYAEALSAAGNALEKHPDNLSCRKLRAQAALKMDEAADNYVIALTDLGYLVDHGDHSESTYRQVGDAEVGLARSLYKVRDYANALRHYKVAREAFVRAQGVAQDPKIYEQILADTDKYIRAVGSEAKF